MASPTHPVFPPPPASWPLPPPPPAAEKKKKEPAAALLYELRFKQVRLLQQALRSLVLTASFESLIPGRGRITGSGHFYISADDLNLVARTLLPPDVDTCLALRQFATFVVPADLVLRFELRRLEEIMERTVVGDGRGLTLILKGENTSEMVYLLTDENGNEVHNSVIPVTSTHVGPDPMGLDW